jgi:hypothetical protein
MRKAGKLKMLNFKKIISLKLKEFDQNFVQRLMKKVKTNIRIASRNGAEELVH